MLACARIGAPHSVVFGGFSAQALADRIVDAEAKLLITADGGYRRGEVFPLKPAADEAVAASSTIEHVSWCVQRGAARRRDGRRSRPLVPRSRRGRRRRLPGRADGRRGPVVPAVHVGHDGQAQGHHAHHRRLPHRHVTYTQQVRLRHPPRHRRLLVHRRRRLGDRSPLHRLRAARQRRHTVMYEGVPNFPGTTASGRSSRSTASRCCTRRPRRSATFMKWGRGAGQARPVEPARDRLGR